MLPSIFRDKLFDDMFDFDDFDKGVQPYDETAVRQACAEHDETDVRETDNSYEMDIDLPASRKMKSC